MSRPLTHASADPADGRLQLCRCSVCHVEAVCTPRFDFYVEGPPAERAGKPLVCETCFFGRLALPRIPDVVVPEPVHVVAARFAREVARHERGERGELADHEFDNKPAVDLAGACCLRIALVVVAQVGPVITSAQAWDLAAEVLELGWERGMPIDLDTSLLRRTARPVAQA